MKQRIRTFVAVELSAEVRRAAADLIDLMAAAASSVKWVDEENLHITLKFLGDVKTLDTAEVCRRVAEATAAHKPFQLEIAGTGAFPKIERPRTIWLGTGEGSAEIIALAESVETEMDAMGFRRESRRFQPHLTLGRIRRPGPELAELSDFLASQSDCTAGRTRVDQVTVFSSELTSSGPSYYPLAHVPICGK